MIMIEMMAKKTLNLLLSRLGLVPVADGDLELYLLHGKTSGNTCRLIIIIIVIIFRILIFNCNHHLMVII